MGIGQRFPRAGGNEGKPDFGFPRFPRPGISTALARCYALLRSCWKVRKSFRLASCIALADSVSLCAAAIRSKLWMLSSGLR